MDPQSGGVDEQVGKLIINGVLQNYVCLHFFKYTSFHVEPASTFANPSIMAILPMCWHNVHHYNALPFGR